MFIREYNCNKLLREDAISAEELDAVFGPFERRKERRQKRRIRTKRVSSNSAPCSSSYFMRRCGCSLIMLMHPFSDVRVSLVPAKQRH